MPRLTIDISDELSSALLSARVDAVAVCLSALQEAVDKRGSPVHTAKMTKQTESKMGRPRKGDAGEKRVYRSVGLAGSNWTWLEQLAASSGRSVNDVLDLAVASCRIRGVAPAVIAEELGRWDHLHALAVELFCKGERVFHA